MQQAPHVVHVLAGHRLVEVQLVACLGDRLRRGAGAEHGVHGVGRRCLLQREQDDGEDEQDHDGGADALGDER